MNGAQKAAEILPYDAKAEPEDSFENMVARAKEKNYPFPYLLDETQEIAKAYGAKRTLIFTF